MITNYNQFKDILNVVISYKSMGQLDRAITT